MKKGLKVKTLNATVSGSQSLKFIKDIQELFKTDYNIPNENLLYSEKYFQNLFKINKLKDSASTFKNNNQSGGKGSKKGNLKNCIGEAKKFNFVFFDKSTLLIINFLFNLVIIGLLDNFVNFAYKHVSNLIFLTCNMNSSKDMDNCFEIVKKYNSEFNFADLSYSSHQELFTDPSFKKKKNLTYFKNLENQEKGKISKISRFFLVLYDNSENNNNTVHQKYEKFSERENKK